MKKTLVALLMAFIMMMTCIPALAVEGPNQDMSIFPLTDEKITITMMHMYTDVMPSDWSTVWFWQQLEELTNVHIDFIPVSNADRKTTLNLRLASGDLPNVLFKMGVSSNQASQYGGEGLLIDLTQYADVMPNFNYWLDAYPTARNAITQSDGKIYGCPYILTGYAIRMGDRFFWNREVLDYAGFTNPPATLQEFHDYLTKIKDWDYDQNPETVTLPLTMSEWEELEYLLTGSFGVMNRGSSNYWADQNEDGTARFWHTADGYKELLRYYGQLFQEGLIDPDTFAKNVSDFAGEIEKCQSGKALTYIFCNNSPVSGSKYEELTVPMTEPLEGFNGEKAWNAYSMPASTGSNFCITYKCPEEYRPILAKWIDYFYSIEGIVAYFMGEEGESYTYDPETDTYELTDKILHDPEGRNFESVQSAWCTWAGGSNPSCATNELFKGGETWPVSIVSAEGLINYTPDKLGGAVWAPFLFDSDVASEVSAMTTNFDTYLGEWAAKFITGEKDLDADWDEYVAGFNELGVDEYLGLINEKIAALGL